MSSHKKDAHILVYSCFKGSPYHLTYEFISLIWLQTVISNLLIMFRCSIVL